MTYQREWLPLSQSTQWLETESRVFYEWVMSHTCNQWVMSHSHRDVTVQIKSGRETRKRSHSLSSEVSQESIVTPMTHPYSSLFVGSWLIQYVCATRLTYYVWLDAFMCVRRDSEGQQSEVISANETRKRMTSLESMVTPQSHAVFLSSGSACHM